MAKVKKNEKVNNYYSYFPKLLRTLLDENQVKQEDIAEYVGVTRQSIAQYKDGITSPDIYTFQKIVEYFQIKQGVNYSLDFWLGTSKINNTTNLNQLNLSAKSIESLMEYQNDKLLMYCLDNIITNKEFLQKLSAYLVLSNLNNIIFNDTFLKDYCELHCCSSLTNDTKAKYQFADIIEFLPLFKDKFKKQLNSNNEELIFEYVNLLMAEHEKYLEQANSDFCNNYANSSETEDFFSTFMDSEQYKNFDKKFNDYLNKKNTCI